MLAVVILVALTLGWPVWAIKSGHWQARTNREIEWLKKF